MATDTLQLLHSLLHLTDCQYNQFWKLVIPNGDLYILKSEITAFKGTPPGSPNYANSSAGLFDAFYTQWVTNSLVLYRGIGGTNLQWPRLISGTLAMQGNLDQPDFSMGGSQSAWIPTDYQPVVPQSIAGSLPNGDLYTRALSSLDYVPVGITVQMFAGLGRGIPVAWLNSGEIVVKGPLASDKYRILSMAWMHDGIAVNHPWTTGFASTMLPLQRPYLPAQADPIVQWWTQCQPYLDIMYAHDPILGPLAANRAHAARCGTITNRTGQRLALCDTGGQIYSIENNQSLPGILPACSQVQVGGAAFTHRTNDFSNGATYVASVVPPVVSGGPVMPPSHAVHFDGGVAHPTVIFA